MRFDDLRVQDAEGRVGEDRRQRRSGGLRREHNRGRVLLRYRYAVEQERRVALDADDAIEREHDVGRSDRGAVGEFVRSGQRQGERLRVGRFFKRSTGRGDLETSPPLNVSRVS